MDAALNWIWQGSVVALATFVMLLALTRARANARYMVCWAAALFIVALPALPLLQSAAVAPDVFPAAPGDAVPVVDRVPAGVLELVRASGADVVTSGALVSKFFAVWTDAEIASHAKHAEILRSTALAALMKARE